MPSQSDHLKANQTTQLIKASGNFWTDMTAGPESVRLLPNLSCRVKLLNQLETGFNQLLSSSDQLLIEDQFVKYDPADVMFVGNQFYDDNSLYDTDGKYYNQSGEQFFWAISLGDVFPLAIFSPTKGELISGRDFFVQDGFLYFLLRPQDLFTDSQYLVSSGVVDRKSIYRWQLNFDEMRQNHYAVQFARVFQSLHYFKLAAAELAGLKIVDRASELLAKTYSGKDSDVVHYVFETQVVVVDYAHTELEVGETYDAHTVIGNGIEIIPPDPNSRRWWRTVDWSNGLSLSGMTDFPAIHVPDEDCWAYIADVDPDSEDGSKLHIRMDIPGDGGADVNAYWDFVHSNETQMGQYLNQITGFGHTDDTVYEGLYAAWIAEDPTRDFDLLFDGSFLGSGVPVAAKMVNPIDLLFEAMLKHTAVVINIRLDQVKNLQDVMKYIYREMPVGISPIVNMTGLPT